MWEDAVVHWQKQIQETKWGFSFRSFLKSEEIKGEALVPQA